MTDGGPEVEWRPIPLWPEFEVSRDGQIRNAVTKRLRKVRMVERVAGPKAAIHLTRKNGDRTMRMVDSLVKEVWGD